MVKKNGDMKELVVDGRKAFVTTMHNSGEGAEDHVAVFQRIGNCLLYTSGANGLTVM